VTAVAARGASLARGAGLAALLAVAGLATVAAGVASASPLAALLPAAAVAFAWVVARAPPWRTAAALVLAVLVLDVSSDAAGLWRTPLAAVGDILQDNLERSAGLPGVWLTGLDVAALVLGAVALARRSDRRRAGWVAPPSVLNAFLLLCVAGVLWAEGVGLVRGEPVVTWKVRQLLDVPVLAAVLSLALRGPADLGPLGAAITAAAVAKALLAVWVQRVAAPALTGGRLEYATNHGDSLLFAVAALVLVVAVAEHRDRRSALRAAVLLPIVLLGMHDNGRRTAWVMLCGGGAAAWAVMPPRRWKRILARALLVAAPVVALYTAVGWNRTGLLFAPIQTLRTLSDAEVDRSTRWRDVENWNLAMSIREHPVLGAGLGARYTEVARNDDISTVFAEYRAWPHNTVLALFFFGGPLGFTAIWAPLALVVFLAARSYPRVSAARERVAALACIGVSIGCAVLAFGDTGAHFVQYRLLLALALAVSGKLAVASGAWPRAARRPRGGWTPTGAESPP
jgi:hypothetical protein